MSALTGKSAKLMYGSVVVAEITEWSMSGLSMGTVRKDDAFGDTYSTYDVTGTSEPGTITCSGNYDPNDTNGQRALVTACAAGTHLTNIYLYAAPSTFWRVTPGGYILCTKANSVTLPRSGYGKTSFEFQVCTTGMQQVGTGT